MKNRKTHYRLKTNLPINGAGKSFSIDEWFARYGYINITASEFFEPVTSHETKKGLNSPDETRINKNI